MDDLKARPKTVREALNEARTRITALEAQLAARDAEIAAWQEALADAAWGLDTAKNALAWAVRRMACADYSNVVQNDANNAGRVLSRARDNLATIGKEQPNDG